MGDEPPKLPPPPAVARTFTPVQPEDVTDAALLPRQFRFLEGEVRELIGVIRRQLIPKIDAIADRITALEREAHAERAARFTLEDRVAEIRIALGVVP